MHVRTSQTFVALTPHIHIRMFLLHLKPVSLCSLVITWMKTRAELSLFWTPELRFHATLEKILLPPFLSDEAAYLGASPRLSFQANKKWHENDGLDCSCLCVMHSKPLLETTVISQPHTHSNSTVYIYAHSYMGMHTQPIDVNPSMQRLRIRSWLAHTACSKWSAYPGFFHYCS